MCACYGLGGGPHDLGLTFDLPPMHEPESRRVLAEWARRERGTARITGRRAENLNPLIRATDAGRRLELGWWWLHVGAQPARFSAFNSRDDALLTSWREPFQHRAILPADWYIERRRTFALPGDEQFGIAAILAPAARPDGVTLLSYSLVTRPAVGGAKEVHNRMPLVLPRELHDAWLDPERRGDGALLSLVREGSDELAAAFRVIDAPASSAAPRERDQPTLF